MAHWFGAFKQMGAQHQFEKLIFLSIIDGGFIDIPVNIAQVLNRQ